MTTAITPLLAECAQAGIRLSVADGKLVVEAPAGMVNRALLERLKQHKAPLLATLSASPATVEVVAPAELPSGWPSDAPIPGWWPEFCSILGAIKLLAARRQVCGDPGCVSEMAVEWEAPGYPRQWACPRCGRAADTVVGPPAAPVEMEKICRCGSTRYRDVPIHNGRSARRDCARCGRFLGFPVWYGAEKT